LHDHQFHLGALPSRLMDVFEQIDQRLFDLHPIEPAWHQR
jgi:hypothetical protein